MKIATPIVMDRIRDCIKNTAMPSWLRSVPYNFSDATAGSMKANKWHTFFTIYLPLALISLWASEGTGSEFEKVLDHTMNLVCSVILACK